MRAQSPCASLGKLHLLARVIQSLDNQGASESALWDGHAGARAVPRRRPIAAESQDMVEQPQDESVVGNDADLNAYESPRSLTTAPRALPRFGLRWILSLVFWAAVLVGLLYRSRWFEWEPARTALQLGLVLLPSIYMTIRWSMIRRSAVSFNLGFFGLVAGFQLAPQMTSDWLLGNLWIGRLGIVGPGGPSPNALSLVFCSCIGTGLMMLFDYVLRKPGSPSTR